MVVNEVVNRRAELLQVAARLFAQKGFKNTTMRDIADGAEMLPGSLYYHFPSKLAIVDEILTTFHNELFSQYAALLDSDLDAREKLIRAIRISFEATNHQRDAITIFENEAEYLGGLSQFGYLAERNVESQEFWITVLQDGVRCGALRANLDVGVAYRFIRDTVWVAPRWHRSDNQLSHLRVAEEILNILLDGMAAR